MSRNLFAGVIGSVAAIAAAFLAVAIVGATGGVPVMYEPDRAVYGWEGAQLGMVMLFFIGFVMVWPFPAIALAGAAIGVFVQSRRNR